MPKEKLFIVNWIKPVQCGSSLVRAKNKKEAIIKAENGKDFNFIDDGMEYNADWEIRNIRVADKDETKEFFLEGK